MRLLIASSVAPAPAGDGSQLQVWNIARGLAARHDVRVVCLGDAEPDTGLDVVAVPGDVPPVGPATRAARTWRAATWGEPVLVAQLRSTGFARAVAAQCASWLPDCVVVTTGPVAFVAEELAGLPVVLSTIDSYSLQERALHDSLSGRARARMRLTLGAADRYERTQLRRYDAALTVAARDAAWMRRLHPDVPVHVVTNGVDARHFSPDASEIPPAGPVGVAFHGVMSYPPNVQAAQHLVRDIMPAVWRADPTCSVRIVGRTPTDDVEALSDERVEVTGAVRDVRSHLLAARVCAYPMVTGTGVKNKVLEAAALGRPVVATPEAVGDLDLIDGVHCLVRSSPKEFAAAIVELAADPQRAACLGAGARELVARRNSWEAAVVAVEAVCRDAIAAHRSTSQSGPAPGPKTVMSTMWSQAPRWRTLVDFYETGDYGSLADHRRLRRLARGKEAVILLGASSFDQRYRDLVFAILLKLRPGPRPRVLVTDATWEPGSAALSRATGLPPRWFGALGRLAVRLLDGPHVRYAVLSTDELETFPRVWGVDPDRVVFTPFPATVEKDTPVRDEGYLFAGGNSLRDYDLLERALAGEGPPTRVAADWRPRGNLPHVTAGPRSHAEFVDLLAGCHAAVVPLRRSMRSAGQQSYLNAMLLGKPTIVTAAPGVVDYIRDGVTGVVVPPDAGALRAAIRDVMDPANAARYAEMGQRARAWALEHATQDGYFDDVLLPAIGLPRPQAAPTPGETAHMPDRRAWGAARGG